MDKFKVLLIIAIVLLAVTFLQADEPELIITALDTLTLPMETPLNVNFPNGDIMFYKFQFQTSGIHFTTFWYLEDSHELTAPVAIGSVYNPGFDSFPRVLMARLLNDKYHLVLSYPNEERGSIEGLLHVTLYQDTLTYRIIDEFTFYPWFDLRHSCTMLAEGALVLALADSLVYYDLNTGESQTLMEGDDYQCNSEHIKQVKELPDGNFLYIRDIYWTGAADAPEIWVLFDSLGNHLFTQEITDPLICSHMNNGHFSAHPLNSPQWFYMPIGLYEGADGWLECSYADADSFHIHYNTCPLPNEIADVICSFGEDKVLVRGYDGLNNSYNLHCYNSPTELNPTPLFSYDFAYGWPLNAFVIDDIFFIIPRGQDGFTHLWAIWAEDFPLVHEFSFPLTHDAGYNIQVSYHENKLRIVTGNAIDFYQVDAIPISNAEDTAVSPVNTLEIYPNPVGRNAGFTIQSDLKKPVELGVYNIRGQKVQTITLDNLGKYRSNAADLLSLNSGIYLLKPLGKEKLPTRKFVVLK